VLPREEIPDIAVALLEDGADTPTLRRLAGLTSLELSEAHDLFRKALQELGRRRPTRDEAARRVATHLASRVLSNGADLRRLATEGARLAVAFDYHEDLMPYYRADDEYDIPGWKDRVEVDAELVESARRLLGTEGKHAG
jgi:hypothetical protein